MSVGTNSIGGQRPPLQKLILGTRGSELARAQTRMVENALREKWSQLTIETKIIKTRGDESSVTVPVANLTGSQAGRSRYSSGRKGLFTAELERALVAHDVDLAVHSAKDLPSELAPETQIAAVLQRGSVDDVLVAPVRHDLHSLPVDGIVATGSVRRKHQLRWKRPDLDIVDLRGNVPTRLRKLAKDQWHAIILARAGLERLALQMDDHRIRYEGVDFFAEPLSREIFLPAGGQGVIAIQIRENDDRARMLVESINDLDTRLCLRAEREFLRLLHGDCNQPVGVLAIVESAIMTMHAQIFDLEATTPREAKVKGPSEDAERLAAELFGRINGE